MEEYLGYNVSVSAEAGIGRNHVTHLIHGGLNFRNFDEVLHEFEAEVADSNAPDEDTV